MTELAGKVVLMTGGGGGLGADAAKVCIDAGASVALLDIAAGEVADTATRMGPSAMAVVADIADEGQVTIAVDAVLARFGRIDVLVNNAAYVDLPGDLDALATDLATWGRTLDVNLTGTLLMARAVLPAMIDQAAGSIINMVSRQGIAPAQSGRRMAYSVSKAAVIMLTRHIAVAYGKRGVRCNAIAPGTIRSDRMVTSLSPERMAQSLANVLTPELGTPADVSAMVAFLASDASRYMTGQVIQIDGGVLSYLHE